MKYLIAYTKDDNKLLLCDSDSFELNYYEFDEALRLIPDFLKNIRFRLFKSNRITVFGFSKVTYFKLVSLTVNEYLKMKLADNYAEYSSETVSMFKIDDKNCLLMNVNKLFEINTLERSIVSKSYNIVGLSNLDSFIYDLKHKVLYLVESSGQMIKIADKNSIRTVRHLVSMSGIVQVVYKLAGVCNGSIILVASESNISETGKYTKDNVVSYIIL